MVGERSSKQSNYGGQLLVPVSSFKEVLTCPICEGLLREPKTIRSCLHAFCGECIDDHLEEQGYSPSCFTCGERLSANCGEVQPDPILQALINRLFPSDDPEKLLPKPRLYKNRDLNLVVEAFDATEEYLDKLHASTEVGDIDFLRESAAVECTLTPVRQSGLPLLAQPYIRTSAQTPVEAIMLWVAECFKVPNEDVLTTVQISLDGNVLFAPSTLEFACRTRRRSLNDVIHLQYDILDRSTI